MSDNSTSPPDITSLIAPFFASLDELGTLTCVESSDMPADYQKLLAHNNHMTVAVERFHNSLVDVRVLDKHVEGTRYARKILLARQSDSAVVQFGVMRVDVGVLDPEVRREIEDEQTPLGRILISHGVLRDVELTALWRVVPGQALRELLSMSPGQQTYGRTALIHVNGQPAVELLEIVAPTDSSAC